MIECTPGDTFVELGEGKMVVSYGHDVGGTVLNQLVIIQPREDERGEIGERHEVYDGMPTNELDRPTVRIRFGNVESLQVVIDALEVCKVSMRGVLNQ